MRKILGLLLFISMGIAPFSATAHQLLCNTRDSLMDQLQEKYDELPAVRGVTSTGYMMEVLSSKDGLTWTIMTTDPKDGRSCLLGIGEGLRLLNPDFEELEGNKHPASGLDLP